MGLFDTLYCHYSLPDPEFQHLSFQTKDLHCTLGNFLITAEGKLWRLRQGVDLFEVNVRPPDLSDKAEDMNYHGDFSFHTDTQKGWLEYRVRFTHGSVEWIRREEE